MLRTAFFLFSFRFIFSRAVCLAFPKDSAASMIWWVSVHRSRGKEEIQMDDEEARRKRKGSCRLCGYIRKRRSIGGIITILRCKILLLLIFRSGHSVLVDQNSMLDRTFTESFPCISALTNVCKNIIISIIPSLCAFVYIIVTKQTPRPSSARRGRRGKR